MSFGGKQLVLNIITLSELSMAQSIGSSWFQLFVLYLNIERDRYK